MCKNKKIIPWKLKNSVSKLMFFFSLQIPNHNNIWDLGIICLMKNSWPYKVDISRLMKLSALISENILWVSETTYGNESLSVCRFRYP